MVKPTIFNRLFKKEITRKKILAYFGGALILIIIFLPSDQENNANKKLVLVENTQNINKNEFDKPLNVANDSSSETNNISITPEDKFNKFNNPSGVQKTEKIEPITQNIEGDNFDKFDKPSTPPESDNSLVYYKVDRVVDGDTVRVFIDGVSQSIRLIGIDTPETVHPTLKVEMYGERGFRGREKAIRGQKSSIRI